jgi:PRTRC genetic system ThiF family protein
MKIEYKAIPQLSQDTEIIVVGCGGTGSLVLSGLLSIVIALRGCGRRSAINITAYDGDIVTMANIGRQPFYPAEIEQNKAVALVNRLNMAGLNAKAEPKYFDKIEGSRVNRLVIGCVDTRKSRRTIKECLKGYRGYYLDCGNDLHSGQVIVGCGHPDYKLPMPWDICPDLVSDAPEDNTPSCSLAEALNSQDLMVNRFAANIALELVWQLLRYNSLEIQGAFFDSRRMRVNPIPIK